jgi:hypothetical protein
MHNLKRMKTETDHSYYDAQEVKRQCLDSSTIALVPESQDMQIDPKPTIDYDLHPALFRKYLNGSFF